MQAMWACLPSCVAEPWLAAGRCRDGVLGASGLEPAPSPSAPVTVPLVHGSGSGSVAVMLLAGPTVPGLPNVPGRPNVARLGSGAGVWAALCGAALVTEHLIVLEAADGGWAAAADWVVATPPMVEVVEKSETDDACESCLEGGAMEGLGLSAWIPRALCCAAVPCGSCCASLPRGPCCANITCAPLVSV